jgi:pimeloyl-ACP methyl ester carboxylesterase/DNA-binding winged helix-turn-helix (wHTH) protein
VIYAFGDYRLDTSLYELRCSGEPCPVEPQVFDLLRFLIENRGRVVTREEILDAVWPGRFVSDAALSSRLKAARKAVGDSGREQNFIRTMHGRGLRFVGEVVEHDPSETATPPFDRPVTRYARSGEVNIAWQSLGGGPVDLIFVMGWVSHVEMFWEEPSFARFLQRLAGFSRLILFDKRGTGLSDRVPHHQLPTLEQRMDDVRAVMDAAQSKRAVIMGVSEGAPMSALFAATYPERTAGLVLIGGYARRLYAPDYPFGRAPEEREAFLKEMERDWGGPVGLEVRAPSRANDPRFREWWASYLRMGASPGAVVALGRMNDQIDVREVLPTIHVPSLIIHRRNERALTIENGRYLAEHIPGAEMVELPGDDHLPFVGDQEEILEPIERFFRRLDPEAPVARSLATVLVVRGEVLDLAPIEFEIRRQGGHTRFAKEAQIVATFDGPARAMRSGVAVVQSCGAGVSAGVHTGYCDFPNNEVSGPALEVAVRIADEAVPGELWVSSTVHDLAAGSGIDFRPLGRTVAVGGAGARDLFAVLPGSS